MIERWWAGKVGKHRIIRKRKKRIKLKLMWNKKGTREGKKKWGKRNL
jgi:hypothetical protein